MIPSPNNPEAPLRRDDLKGEGAIRGTARMEAFADGVFAIAFTLSVFQIVLPDGSRDSANLGSDLLGILPAYGGYLLASMVIGLYWVHHHFSGAIYRTTGHWFLVASVIFLAAIGFIAFPARVFAEHFGDPVARPVASQYLVISLALLSATWLVKWTVGRLRGQVDARLDPVYVDRLDRHYRHLFFGHAIAAILVFFKWEVGLGVSALLTLRLLLPPETPQYTTESPVVEGEGN
ncbi:MAG TPA: TMEM175 family protein [Sphingomicrobium sp.]|nr:TMEM175 family protein [Sphingomicrobium sp.]